MEKTLDNNGQNDGKQVDSGGCKVVWLITFSRIVKMEYEAIIEAENITEATKLFEKTRLLMFLSEKQWAKLCLIKMMCGLREQR